MQTVRANRYSRARIDNGTLPESETLRQPDGRFETTYTRLAISRGGGQG